MGEREWSRGIRSGKKEYLTEAAEKYYDDIYRFCCFETGNAEDSYDLAQETFLRFIRYAGDFSYRNLKGYLLTVAMNVCRDYFHRENGKSIRENGTEEELLSRAEPGEHGPEAAAERDDYTDRLLNALSGLPQIQRDAILLHYFQELKYREIARLTGTGTATVKSRVRQGMSKLREMLGEDFAI